MEGSLLVHQVTFRFKSGVDWSSTQAQEAEKITHSHPKAIPQIKGWHCGRSVVSRSDAADFGVIGYFSSLADLAIYQDHPEHQRGVAAWSKISDWQVSDLFVSTKIPVESRTEVHEQWPFDTVKHKVVVLVADDLPIGLAMNALSVISVSIGRRMGGIVGPDVFSNDAICYPGVTTTPLPILRASPEIIDSIFRNVRSDDSFLTTPFSRLAQSCRTYEEYGEKVSRLESDNLALAALGLVGPRKEVNSITGSFSLYR